jgi:hypothetical protein
VSLAPKALDSYRLSSSKIIEIAQISPISAGSNFALSMQTDASLALEKMREYFQIGEVYISTSLFQSNNWVWTNFRNSDKKFEGRCWLTTYRLVLWVAGERIGTGENGQKLSLPDGRDSLINIPLALIAQMKRKGVLRATNTMEFSIFSKRTTSQIKVIGARSHTNVSQKPKPLELPEVFDLTFFEGEPNFIESLKDAHKNAVSANADALKSLT